MCVGDGGHDVSDVRQIERRRDRVEKRIDKIDVDISIDRPRNR